MPGEEKWVLPADLEEGRVEELAELLVNTWVQNREQAHQRLILSDARMAWAYAKQ